MSMINTGVSGMFAAQTALNVASKNIAGAPVPGYTRQQVNYATSPTGTVYVSDVRRVTDSYLTSQVWDTATAYGYSTAYYSHASQIETLVTSDGTSLSPVLEGFFGALNSAAADPSSDASRQTVLKDAENLSSRFNSLYNGLQKQAQMTNDQLQVMVSDVNGLMSDLAAINEAIMASQSGSGVPNDLLDQRDQTVQQLSELLDITADTRPDGTVDIFLPSGEPLVMRGEPNELVLRAGDPDSSQLTLSLVTDTAEKPLSEVGGSMQGLIDFRDEVIDPALRELGRIAIVLADTVNEKLGEGYDLNGDKGSPLFSDVNSTDVMRERAESSRNNTGSGVLEIGISDSSSLTADGYTLDVMENDKGELRYTLSRNGEVVSEGAAADLDAGVEVDGMTIRVAEGSLAAGDSFGIEPTSGFSGSMATVMDDPSKLAFSGKADEPGDNSNLLGLVDIAKQPLVGGKNTLSESWNLMVTDIGNTTAQAASSYNASKVLHEEATNALLSVAGVNLDEEAASLVIYQQAYQANAKVISTAQQLLDTVLGL